MQKKSKSTICGSSKNRGSQRRVWILKCSNQGWFGGTPISGNLHIINIDHRFLDSAILPLVRCHICHRPQPGLVCSHTLRHHINDVMPRRCSDPTKKMGGRKSLVELSCENCWKMVIPIGLSMVKPRWNRIEACQSISQVQVTSPRHAAPGQSDSPRAAWWWSSPHLCLDFGAKLVISMHHSGDLTIQNERFHHRNLQTGAFTYLSIYLSS